MAKGQSIVVADIWQVHGKIERTVMGKKNQLILGTVVRCFQVNGGKDYTIARMRQWICDDVGKKQGMTCDPSDFSNCINKGKPIVGFAYEYYENRKNLPEIVKSVQENVMDVMLSPSALMSDLRNAVYADGSLLPETAEELLSGTDAEIVANILRFSIVRMGQKKLPQKDSIEDLLEDVKVPQRAPKLIGREDELGTLRERLLTDQRVFVMGIGGVGKSELVQSYARRYANEYKNRIYLTYHGSLHKTIAMLRLNNEAAATDDRHYERNLRLLRSMREDSLLIIDNLDDLPENSRDLGIFDKLNCHVLVTTRLKTWGKYGYFLDMLCDRDALLRLFYLYCPQQKAGEEENVWSLIEQVHHHTYAIQLLALTVKAGYQTSGELTRYIREQGLAFPNTIFVETTKDGNYDWKPFYNLLEGLFTLQDLGEPSKRGLINFCIMPENGVRKRQFILWSELILETQTLIRLGWLQEDENTDKLYIHGLVREMVFESLHPTVEECFVTLQSILETYRKYGREYHLEDYEGAMEICSCNSQIIRLINQNATIYNNPYMVLITIYAFRIQHESVWRIFEVKKANTDIEKEADLFRTKREQFTELKEWNLKLQKYCCEKLEYASRHLVLNNELFNELFYEVAEEYKVMNQIYEQTKSEYGRLRLTASHQVKKKVYLGGKHSKGRTKPSHKR